MAKETIPSLHNAFLGKPLETDIWENPAFIGGRILTEGEPACSSANWCTTACAVALYAGRPYARGWWMQYFEHAHGRFMGKEPFSRIYAHWMAYPVMYVAWHSSRKGDTELYGRAKNWLRAFWTYLCIAGVDRDQKNQFDNTRTFPAIATSFCGARSFERGDDAHGNRHRGSPYHLDSWITGTLLKRALSDTAFPAGWFEDAFEELRAMEQASFNWTCLTEDEKQTLIRILRNQIGPAEVQAILDWAGPYKTLPAFRLIRTASGVTLYMEELVGTGTSGETAPIYGCFTSSDGEQQWLAPDNGYRPVGEMSQIAISFGSTKVENGRVFVRRGDGRVFPENNESLRHSIPLPAGQPILDIRFGNKKDMEVIIPSSVIEDPPLHTGAWISRADFENFVWDKYFRHLPEGSESREVLQHLFQALYILMGATDPSSAALRLAPDDRRRVEEALTNTLARLRR